MLDQSNVIIDVHVHAQDSEVIKEEIRSGLLLTPKKLPTKYFYDDWGSTPVSYTHLTLPTKA